VASRLSYLFWASMPDDRLFELAAAGKLGTATEIMAEARRLLTDPKARDGIVDFHLQWLDVDGLPDLEKDPALTSYSPAVAASMLEETRRFTADLFTGPGAHRQLRDPADLAAHVRRWPARQGLWTAGQRHQRHGLHAGDAGRRPAQRILTEAGFLAMHARPGNPTRCAVESRCSSGSCAPRSGCPRTWTCRRRGSRRPA
jgi:hypothetical protein